MKYEFGDVLKYSQAQKDEFYIFVSEEEGMAIIYLNIDNEMGYVERSKILKVPFGEILLNSDYGRLETNEIESIFPMDISVGDVISDAEERKYKILSIKPVFFPEDEKCLLLVQDEKYNVSIIEWAKFSIENSKDNWFYEQNLNIGKFSKFNKNVYTKDTSIYNSGRLMDTVSFKFIINSSDPINILGDIEKDENDIGKNGNDIDFFYIIEDNLPKNLSEIYVSSDRSCDSRNEITFHINNAPTESIQFDNRYKKNYNEIKLIIKSGIFTMKNNNNEYVRLNTREEISIIVASENYEFAEDKYINKIEIYINGVLENQMI